jgi:hypothetical protein
MRENARKLTEMADGTPDKDKKARLGKMSNSWSRMANTQARLDGEGHEGGNPGS